MKKILAIVMALAIVMLFGACGANETSTETSTTTAGLEATTSSAAADETVSEEKQLLEELLATADDWIGLADEAYKNVVNYMKNNMPDDNMQYVTLEWELEDYTLNLNNDTRRLSLVNKDGYSKMLCQNVDFPNIRSSVAEFTVIDEVSFYNGYKSIEVWQFGEELYKVDLPSSDSEIFGYIDNAEEKKILVRSDSTIGAITWTADNKFQYNEIVSDCAGPIGKYLCSMWYVNKDGNLVHVNLLNFEMETIAKNVTNLVDVHDGTYSTAWREKGSLEWHEPEYCITPTGEKTPWAERGGM